MCLEKSLYPQKGRRLTRRIPKNRMWVSEEGTGIVSPCFNVGFVSNWADRELAGDTCSVRWGCACLSAACQTPQKVTGRETTVLAHEVCALKQGAPSSRSSWLRRCESSWVGIKSSTGGHCVVHFRRTSTGDQTRGASASPAAAGWEATPNWGSTATVQRPEGKGNFFSPSFSPHVWEEAGPSRKGEGGL